MFTEEVTLGVRLRCSRCGVIAAAAAETAASQFWGLSRASPLHAGEIVLPRGSLQTGELGTATRGGRVHSIQD